MQNMTNLDVTVDFFTRRTQDSANLTKSNGPSDFAEICRSKGSWRRDRPRVTRARQRRRRAASREPAAQTGERRHPGWLAQTGERVVCDEHGCM